MKVIVAPNEIPCDNFKVYLAGGITNCHNWQKDVIEYIRKQDVDNKLEKLTLCNPRRDNFDIAKDDPFDQIIWEQDAINYKTNIFSMYFCNSESDQPICMYELGVRIARITDGFYSRDNLIISIENGYKRTNDVVIQTKLELPDFIINMNATPESHAKLILDKYYKILEDDPNIRNIRISIDELEKQIPKKIRHTKLLIDKYYKILEDNILYNHNISKYRMAVDALEKRIPKKPKKIGYFNLCPTCYERTGSFDYEYLVKKRDKENISYCSVCGQAIDFTEDE